MLHIHTYKQSVPAFPQGASNEELMQFWFASESAAGNASIIETTATDGSVRVTLCRESKIYPSYPIAADTGSWYWEFEHINGNGLGLFGVSVNNTLRDPTTYLVVREFTDIPAGTSTSGTRVGIHVDSDNGLVRMFVRRTDNGQIHWLTSPAGESYNKNLVVYPAFGIDDSGTGCGEYRIYFRPASLAHNLSDPDIALTAQTYSFVGQNLAIGTNDGFVRLLMESDTGDTATTNINKARNVLDGTEPDTIANLSGGASNTTEQGLHDTQSFKIPTNQYLRTRTLTFTNPSLVTPVFLEPPIRFTLEMSFYMSSAPTPGDNDRLICDFNHLTSWNNAQIDMYVIPDMNVHLNMQDSNSTIHFLATGTPAVLNQWNHVAVVGNENVLSLYMNGTLQSQITNFSGMKHENDIGYTFFGVGAYDQGTINLHTFTGYMDQIRFSRIDRYSGATYTVPTGNFA